jgi:hypothetical protein
MNNGMNIINRNRRKLIDRRSDEHRQNTRRAANVETINWQ